MLARFIHRQNEQKSCEMWQPQTEVALAGIIYAGGFRRAGRSGIRSAGCIPCGTPDSLRGAGEAHHGMPKTWMQPGYSHHNLNPGLITPAVMG